MSENVNPKKVITSEATLSYPWLVTPQEPDKTADPGTKAKYSATFVFAKGTDLKALVAAVMAAAEEKWPGKVPDMIAKSRASVAAGGPMTFRLPFRADGADKYGEGTVFVCARTTEQPQFVYAHAVPGTNKPETVPKDKIEEVFYPGAKVRASLVAFPYDRKGNKGVSFALNNMQKLGEGERLDNRVSAENEFDADLTQAPADLAGILG